MSSLEERARKIIADQLDLDLEEVVSDAKFIDDLGADSLDIVELVMAMEDEFKIEIPEEDSAKILRVGDVFDYLREKTGGA